MKALLADGFFPFRAAENYPSSLGGYRLRAPLAGDGPAYRRRRVARSTPALGKLAEFPGRRRRRNFPGGNVASGGTQSSRDHFSTCSTRVLGRVSCAPCACVRECVWPPSCVLALRRAARRASPPSGVLTPRRRPPRPVPKVRFRLCRWVVRFFVKRTGNTLHSLSARNS